MTISATGGANSNSDFRPEVRRSLPTMIALRLALNTGSRMMFTFLPEFSRGTGIGVDQLGRLLSVQDLSGLTAPFVGRATDRVGTRRIMIAGASLAAVGMILATLGALGMAIGICAYGIGRLSNQVGMNSWIGNEVAYERRARATGRIEMTWAGAALIGLPAIGLLIDEFGWRAAPAAIAVLLGPLSLLLSKRLPKPSEVERPESARPRMTPSVIATLAAYTLLNASAQLLIFSHGIWLEDVYDFDPSQIGFAIVAVGAAELTASYATSRVTDRMGKRNAVATGAFVLTLGLAGLAALPDPPLVIGLGLLVVSFWGFEFGVVSAIPLVAELDPLARAEMIGRAVGLSILARSAGSFVAATLILDQGFRFTMAVGVGLALLTTALTAVAVVEPRPPAVR